ncbi:hypothetical protein [Saccharothrix yanglingensis]|uniref:Uncharacterized protein n=1 Tax=Saccharothrix yanglingensis TaxID=659496 RepID=A0ABU0X3C9_9PSEU|nr:hypothetical protein [Saccharothrix yanglingensis]MDQ2585794.1 hypothetical protein [Saccharothrix yanglingensis]
MGELLQQVRGDGGEGRGVGGQLGERRLAVGRRPREERARAGEAEWSVAGPVLRVRLDRDVPSGLSAIDA